MQIVPRVKRIPKHEANANLAANPFKYFIRAVELIFYRVIHDVERTANSWSQPSESLNGMVKNCEIIVFHFVQHNKL